MEVTLTFKGADLMWFSDKHCSGFHLFNLMTNNAFGFKSKFPKKVVMMFDSESEVWRYLKSSRGVTEFDTD